MLVSSVDMGALLQIVWVDLMLSADNAIAIGLVVSGLPLQHKRLGIVLGAGAAVVMRIVYTFFVGTLLDLAGMRLAGGALLLVIAVGLVADHDMVPGAPRAGPASSLPRAIGLILVADICMSLDNVLAIAALARGDLCLLIFGLALSVVLLVTCSTTLSARPKIRPLLVIAGGMFLAWTAAQLAAGDRLIGGWTERNAWFSWALGALALVMLFVLTGILTRRRR